MTFQEPEFGAYLTRGDGSKITFLGIDPDDGYALYAEGWVNIQATKPSMLLDGA